MSQRKTPDTQTMFGAANLPTIDAGIASIDLAAAPKFAAEGCSIGIADLQEQAVRTAAGSISSDVLALTGSVTELADMDGAVAAMAERFGGLDCMIAETGIVKVEPSLDVALETFRRMLEVNVLGTWPAVQGAAREMTRGGGSIVMIGSVYGAGRTPNVRRTAP